MRLGNPPREYNVQIDTGSDILWVTCNSCNDCPRTSGLGVMFSCSLLRVSRACFFDLIGAHFDLC